MATVSLAPGAWANGFTATDLDALAHNGQKTSTAAAPQVVNQTGAALYAQFEVTLAALSPTVGAHVVVVLVPETQTANTYLTGADGTAVGDHVRWQNCPHAVIALRQTGAAAQVQRSGPVPILPERYRLVLINRAGVALAATGNQVAVRLITETVA